MAYSTHALVSFGGRLGTAPSIDGWQCGVRIRSAYVDNDYVGARDIPDPGLYLTRIQATLKSWFQTASSAVSGSERVAMRNDATLDWVKCNNIDTTGKYLDRSHSHTYVYPTAGVGGGVPGMPTFVTLAVSLLTDKSRGPGHRGRLYLPWALGAPNATGVVASYQGYNRTVGALLSLLEAQTAGGAVEQPVQAVVASKIDGSTNKIVQLATGSVMDVQRRRKEQIPEVYYTLAYP